MGLTRVGYVAKVFPRLSETFVINEIRELEGQGMDIHIFSLHHPPAAVPHRLLGELRAPVTCVETVTRPSGKDCEKAAVVLSERFEEAAQLGDRLFPRKYVRLALQLVDGARSLGLRRLHAHFASRAAHVAMLASQLLGVPYSFTAHAKDIYHEEVDRDLLRVKMRYADLVVTVSEFNRQALLQIGAGIPDVATKVVRLYNGVDLSLFHRGTPDNRVSNLFLAVGRLVEKKGFPTLIRACSILRERGVPFAGEIVGSGPEESLLQDLIRDADLGHAVRLRGALPVEEVATAIRRASLVVLPCIVGSDGNVDALPTVLLEAMASGVPVISSKISGIPEIIADGETGYLVPAGDPAAIADAMQRILQDPIGADGLGKAARQRAERLFDLRSNVAQLRAWLTAAAPQRSATC
jgi:glycosyltransferase involved in cell wall biosynthesis